MRHSPEPPLFLIQSKRQHKPIGIHLFADFTAEHEWGIKELKRAFGIPERDVTEGPFNMERVKASIVPENYHFATKGEEVIFGVFDMRRETDPFKGLADARKTELGNPYARRSTKEYGACHIELVSCSGWDEGNFVVITKDPKAARFLEVMDKAVRECDILVFQGPSGLFMNGGLNIGIASKASKELKENFEKVYGNAAKLHADARATGIYDKVPRELYFALSPRELTNDQKKRTRHPVAFWLNPIEQQRNNYGSFTVEELELWMEGKGPIPKVKEKV